jgi:hypothetical protein
MSFNLKVVRSKVFLLFFTLYIIVSSAAFWLTTGGYSIILLLLFVAPLYLIVWIAIVVACLKSSRIRYSLLLTYLVLFVQSIAVLFNIPDGGFYGITCSTKNFLQSFFDPSSCTGLWVSQQVHLNIAGFYLLLVFLFVCDTIRLTFVSPDDRQ